MNKKRKKEGKKKRRKEGKDKGGKEFCFRASSWEPPFFMPCGHPFMARPVSLLDC
jgi:hypothetical protein